MSQCKICHTSHTWDELDERGRSPVEDGEK